MKPLIGDGTGDAAGKLVFLSKAQREQLALQRSREEIQNQKKRQRETRSSNSESDHNFASHRDRKRNRSSSNSMRKRECKRVAGAGDLIVQRLKLVDRERETIKEQYLGSNKLKKRVIIKPSDKFRFSFDWDYALEDTYRDVDNSLYRNPHEAQLLFGRGFRAGMDRREQKRSQQQREIPRDLYDTFDTRLDNRHWSEKKVEEMKDRDWRIFREDFNISYKGSKIPKPMRNWGESTLSPELLKAVERVGYKKPSPIQMASIPLGLQQRDVIGIAQTGSGKTAAFVLPMLDYIIRNRLSDEPMHNVMSDQDKEGPCALVLAPTRELAQQIEVETNKFARNLGVNVVSIVGGQSIEEQGVRIRKGCEVVIATPGRLNDCLDNFKIVLNQCNYVVLDEADRMMDMGFESQVVRILNKMPSTNLKPENVVEEELCGTKIIYRTTYMFSATMVPGVERLVRKYLRNPVVVTTIGTSAGKAITNDLISQGVYKVKEAEKLSKLQRLLDGLGDDHKTAIVFVKTRSKADTVAKNLEKASGGRYSVTCFHGGKSQEQREISLEGFRNKRHSVLVATDIAGRGIDIPDVAHVINYDMPKDIEVYTHRIGRTGRAGKTGVATTFLTPQDEDTPVSNEIKQMAKRHVCLM